MTKQEEKDFKRLIKEGTLEALNSTDGQEAVVSAMRSTGGKNAIKEGTLEALRSEEGQDILTDNFVNGFNEVVLPALEDHHNRIKKVERTLEMQSI